VNLIVVHIRVFEGGVVWCGVVWWRHGSRGRTLMPCGVDGVDGGMSLLSIYSGKPKMGDGNWYADKTRRDETTPV